MYTAIKRIGAAFLALFVSLAVATAPAPAQQAYDDATLESFVAAAIAVEQLIAVWTPKVQAAESPEQAEELALQANGEMTQAIEGTDGMSVESFQGIMQTLNEDQALRDRVDAIYRRRVQE